MSLRNSNGAQQNPPEAIILIGIQATGKSTFCARRFWNTHVRINLDMLRTRHRERILVDACLTTKQSFVVDNTNPTKEDRARYIPGAKDAGFKVIGYYFRSSVKEALARNEKREDRAFVPETAIRGTSAKLELPGFDEGFDELYYVNLCGGCEFTVEKYEEDLPSEV